MTKLRKLNKRLIIACLMGGSCLGIMAAVLPGFSKEGAPKEHIQMASLAHLNSRDASIISGTDRFPESYSELKGFEKELKKDENNHQINNDTFKAFEQTEQNIQAQPLAANTGRPQRYGRNDDPWLEAREREEKRRAFDHYDARRSDILFIDHGKKSNDKGGQKEEDPMVRMMESSLKMAQNLSQPPKNDMFFINKGREKAVGVLTDAVPFTISQGTLIPAILQTEIDTSLPGPILARVSQNIWDSKTGQALLVPQNSTLIGEYSSTIGNGQTRAQIVWSRIIFPNQQSVSLGEMVGVDKRGSSGATGSVDNHYDKVIMGLLLTTALGTSVRMTQGKYNPANATIGQDLGNTLAQETASLGNKITDKMLSIPPTIKVPMGERLNVFVEQDLNLKAYQG
jgi:type IV secretory pathway VirB10-like protein